MITVSATLDSRRSLRGGLGEVAALAYPAVLQTLSDTTMHVVDTAIVGHLGTTPLGAVGFGGIWLWTMTVFFVGTGLGVQTFVAQAYGAGQRRACGDWLWQGFYALVPLIILWTIVLRLGLGALLHAFGSSPELSQLATQYVQMRLFGLPAIVIGIVFASLFRGLGNTRIPLAAAIITNCFNAFAAYVLVRGELGMPALGVRGAGIATATANWLGAAILVAAALRPGLQRELGTWPTPPKIAAIRRFLRTSGPIGGQHFLDMITFALFATVIARMGDLALAANQAMIQLLSLSFMQAYGISIANAALTGRYIGAGDLESARRTCRSSLQLGMMLAFLVAALFIIAPEPLLRLFSDDPQIITLGRPLLLVAAVFQFIDAYQIIVGGALRGAGDTRWPFAVQTSLGWLLRLPLVLIAVFYLQAGVIGAWMGEMLYLSVFTFAMHRRFHSGTWRTLRV